MNDEATALLKDLANGGASLISGESDTPVDLEMEVENSTPTEEGDGPTELNTVDENLISRSSSSLTNTAGSSRTASESSKDNRKLSTNGSSCGTGSKKRKITDPIQAQLAEIIDRNSMANDPLKHFLVSLLPHFKKVPEEKIVQTQIKMLQLLEAQMKPSE